MRRIYWEYKHKQCIQSDKLAKLSITPNGNLWNEGVEINPSTVDGYSGIFFRSTANSLTASWAFFDANNGDSTGLHSLGIAMYQLTGMSGTGRPDVPFSITTAGVSRFGGNVGIGATAPNALLSLGSAVTNIKLAVYDGGGTNMYGIGVISGALTFGAQIATSGGAAPQMVLTNTGKVGIGTTTPSYNLYVSGSAGGTQSWNQLSDARLKKDVTPITGALGLVEQLRGVRFYWRSVSEREVGKSLTLPVGQAQLGFIAQEVEKVAPEVVSVPKSGTDGIYGLRESELMPLLVEAVKMQQAEIEQLRAEVTALKSQSK